MQKSRYEKNWIYPLYKKFEQDYVKYGMNELFNVHFQLDASYDDMASDFYGYSARERFQYIYDSSRICIQFARHRTTGIENQLSGEASVFLSVFFCYSDHESFIEEITKEKFADLVKQAVSWVKDYESCQESKNKNGLEALLNSV